MESGPADEYVWPSHPEIPKLETGNFLLVTLQQILHRVAWIFKTESVIMPAVLDQVSGSGVVRGILPIFNRFGQSVPPIFFASFLAQRGKKKWALFSVILFLSMPFAVLSVGWFLFYSPSGSEKSLLMTVLFLAMYCVFFIAQGLYLLCMGTIQGKLIRPNLRGRLLLSANLFGAVPACLLAWYLLGDWLRRPDSGFGHIFGFIACGFFISALVVTFLREPADSPKKGRQPQFGSLGELVSVIREDKNLLQLMFAAATFGTNLIIFPHYQAFARESFGLSGIHLLHWVIIQQIAVGLFSLLIGLTADRWGNRLTLQLVVFGSATGPALAAAFSWLSPQFAAPLFWIIFVALGIVPMVLRILTNYTLEICAIADQPRYLSTVNLALACSFVLAPFAGWLVDVVGFRFVFLTVMGFNILSGLITLRLIEPRHHDASSSSSSSSAASRSRESITQAKRPNNRA